MFHDFINLLYPSVCHICDAELLKNEELICTSCLHDLPITSYHLDNENPVIKVFYGRVKIEKATALLHFRKKAGVQQLIHDLKYRGYREIGTYFGQWLGKELADSDWFGEIDMIIPVPLHKSKLIQRGYNQVEDFAKELALSLNAEYADDILLKISATQTQTLKDRLSRWGKLKDTLLVQNSEKIRGKHILLVDDLVTTGATLEACVLKLYEAQEVEISIATMAITD
ncbi:ComF family protein [Christiangramia forsetii]|uniref:Phosphoribosyltransferases family protein n=2 Tax=Christiangramia forsetii TaxID=411153 RepID=A0M775_CHRFK|nr:phosphoribosyltransferase family protein [Christiangramia forsetii]GGG28553.1 amidophosphoribosyltransferase [Christiangramia forsetii]CAL68470.1 phosphoribosyltransferases family protein [Christiangramia forsetii KT0803]